MSSLPRATILPPHEAQRLFQESANEVKPPQAFTATPQPPNSIVLHWNRRLSSLKVDGFVILLGTEPNNLNEYRRVLVGDDFRYQETLTDLEDGKTYYLVIVAYRGEHRSAPSKLWRVVTSAQFHKRIAEKLENTTIATPSVTPPPIASVPTNKVTTCNQCNGDVTLDESLHLFVCQNCHVRYVQRVTDSAFVNVESLRNGICHCCTPRRPLVKPRGEQLKQCALTHEQYISVTNGDLIKVADLDYGLCACCQPPHPLRLNQSGQMVCSHQLDRLYRKVSGGYQMVSPETPIDTVDEIDRALADASARMLPNGVLISRNRRRNR